MAPRVSSFNPNGAPIAPQYKAWPSTTLITKSASARLRSSIHVPISAPNAGGLDAPVDERGANFSAGEAQLLAFARALYRDAPILLLDEATASIDSETEARLQRALDAVLEGRTALVIAHRLSTIRAADRIAVFHRGEVVETGTHEELLARGGIYAALYRLQFSRQEREAERDGERASG